jgi:hypothetical protein
MQRACRQLLLLPGPVWWQQDLAAFPYGARSHMVDMAHATAHAKCSAALEARTQRASIVPKLLSESTIAMDDSLTILAVARGMLTSMLTQLTL